VNQPANDSNGRVDISGLGSQEIVDTMSGALRPIRRVALSLGSNLGESFETLQGAVDALLSASELVPVAVSPVYETDPVGGPEQSTYLNAVLVVDTTLRGRMLLERAQAAEEAFGRERDERWGPRTLDVDVLAVGDRVVDEDDLQLPHPRAHERAFVLVPWADVDPDFELPGHGRVGDLAAAIDRSGVRRRDDLELVLA
jgi:2-amino-4-hydroxy-6-hydroxymethyldihydropteridine diphosphokinase